MSSSSEKTKYPYGYGLSKISLLKLYMSKASVEKWSRVLGLFWAYRRRVPENGVEKGTFGHNVQNTIPFSVNIEL